MSTQFWSRLQLGVDHLKAVTAAEGDDPAKVDAMTPAAVFAAAPALSASVIKVTYGFTCRREGPVAVAIEAAPVMKVEPTSWVGECLRLHVQAAIDAGLYIPPQGETASDVVAGMTFSPDGSKTVIGDDDVERVDLGFRVELDS